MLALSGGRQVFAGVPVQNPLEGCQRTAAKKWGSCNYKPLHWDNASSLDHVQPGEMGIFIFKKCEEWCKAYGHCLLFREEGQKAKRIDSHHNTVYDPMNWRSQTQ